MHKLSRNDAIGQLLVTAAKKHPKDAKAIAADVWKQLTPAERKAANDAQAKRILDSAESPLPRMLQYAMGVVGRYAVRSVGNEPSMHYFMDLGHGRLPYHLKKTAPPQALIAVDLVQAIQSADICVDGVRDGLLVRAGRLYQLLGGKAESTIPEEYQTVMTLSDAAEKLGYAASKSKRDAGRKQVEREISRGELRAERLSPKSKKWRFDSRQL